MRRLLLCLFSVAAVSACGNPVAKSDVPAAAPLATSSPTSITASVTAAVPDSLAFSARRVGGGTVDLARYAGKPVVLWFWAPT